MHCKCFSHILIRLLVIFACVLLCALRHFSNQSGGSKHFPALIAGYHSFSRSNRRLRVCIWPFPSCPKSLYEYEGKCKVFDVKVILVLSKNETHLPLKTEGFVNSEVAYYGRGPFLDKLFFCQCDLIDAFLVGSLLFHALFTCNDGQHFRFCR